MPAVWTDPAVDWDAFALVVVRSTWDYITRRDAFLTWAHGVPRLANSAAVLEWNTDKRYLAELAAVGLPVVPTTFVEPGGAPDAAALSGEVVVKPAMSVGSLDTGRHADPDAAAAHVARLHEAGRTAMLQPYVAGVDGRARRRCSTSAGAGRTRSARAPCSSASARPSTGCSWRRTSGRVSRRPPSSSSASASWRSSPKGSGPLLYARVDLLPGPGGEPLVVEVELTEPSLYLETNRGRRAARRGDRRAGLTVSRRAARAPTRRPAPWPGAGGGSTSRG